jgi:hypothetical protein
MAGLTLGMTPQGGRLCIVFEKDVSVCLAGAYRS